MDETAMPTTEYLFMFGIGFVFTLSILILEREQVVLYEHQYSLKVILGISIIVGLFGIIMALLIPFGEIATKEIIRWINNPWQGSHFAFAAIATFAAVALFVFRKVGRAFYGITEVVAGVLGLSIYPVAPAVRGQTLTPIAAAWLIGALSLIYIIVRGLDNIDNGVATWRARRRLARTDNRYEQERENF